MSSRSRRLRRQREEAEYDAEIGPILTPAEEKELYSQLAEEKEFYSQMPEFTRSPSEMIDIIEEASLRLEGIEIVEEKKPKPATRIYHRTGNNPTGGMKQILKAKKFRRGGR